jgi:hypothetical protein
MLFQVRPDPLGNSVSDFLETHFRAANVRLAAVILDLSISAILCKLLFQLSDNGIDLRIALA